MGRIKKILFVIAFGMIMVTMGGCVYSNNKNWSDMTLEEMHNITPKRETPLSVQAPKGVFLFLLQTLRVRLAYHRDYL